MAVRIKWLGPKYTKGLYKHIDTKMERSAQSIKRAAQGRAPVDTGALRESITVGRVKQMEYRVSTDKDYAKAIEYGTSNTPAHPYLRPALRRGRGI